MTEYDLKRKIAAQLREGRIENAVREADWIVKYADCADYDNYKIYGEITRRRVNGEPLQYLLGEWEFYGYPFKVGKGVFIPRPETELLVDIALEHLNKPSENKPENRLVCDLCAGSGCVGISVRKNADCGVCMIEKSSEAFAYLETNFKRLLNTDDDLCVQADIFDCGEKEWVCEADIILINPPYLTKEEMDRLQKEVTYEPVAALYGGMDGLDFYRKVFGIWGRKLKQGGLFAAEVGDGQSGAVKAFMRETGLFEEPRAKKDFNGIERIVYGVKL